LGGDDVTDSTEEIKDPPDELEKLADTSKRFGIPRKRLLTKLYALERSTGEKIVLQKSFYSGIFINKTILDRLRGKANLPVDSRFAELETEVGVLRGEVVDLRGDVKWLLNVVASRKV
jgi:hypothetical protein